MLDLLNVVRALTKRVFTLAEVYAFAGAVARLHPQNRLVGDEIRPAAQSLRAAGRQQLQRLRDMGFVEFVAGGIPGEQ